MSIRYNDLLLISMLKARLDALLKLRKANYKVDEFRIMNPNPLSTPVELNMILHETGIDTVIRVEIIKDMTDRATSAWHATLNDTLAMTIKRMESCGVEFTDDDLENFGFQRAYIDLLELSDPTCPTHIETETSDTKEPLVSSNVVLNDCVRRCKKIINARRRQQKHFRDRFFEAVRKNSINSSQVCGLSYASQESYLSMRLKDLGIPEINYDGFLDDLKVSLGLNEDFVATLPTLSSDTHLCFIFEATYDEFLKD